ncbi:hypothetical protein D4764_04G0012050 [Takifugu flavidus]|uniref:Uncharacterized protein n=1 Tax=Takifugu flavidus TaxID=433684 RepID=A0A5C6N733_9TELE|nr:hypothetical protein D4764_04G0012050 [Takifugu flavidus]
MANQVNELMHLKYERAHLAYLHAVQNVREAEAGAYGQRTIGQYVRMEDRPRAFGPYEDQEGWGGVSVSQPHQTARPEHCRTKIPTPSELLERGGSSAALHLATDPNHVPLFKPSMLKTWRVQRVHILRGCLSDPELSEGIMYRDGGTLQLNHVAGEGAKVPVWIPVRGTSQQEGYHFQQPSGSRRPVDMKKPGAVLPAVFDPASMWELNSASMAVTGQDKCPAFTSLTETLEKDVSGALPLPLKSSPRSARTGPMKTGGGVFVLDHTRWTLPMKDAIDSLLQYHHGDKDILRLVDRDYADMVHRSAADPNSLLRPTTRFHISRYVKHLAKLLNTSSSLNTSPEKLLETQQLWYSLTEGSKTTSVPVVTMETAVVTLPQPPCPRL